MFNRLLVVCCLIVFGTGCTHTQLRKNAVRQAWSVSDFHRQQVLNNLALFAYDFNALPSFSFPNQSSAVVTDQGTVGLTPGFARPTAGPANVIGQFVFATLGISMTGSRSAQEGFTVTPVNDPRKLELMRCAYQKSLRGCGRGIQSTQCPDCKTRFNVFYTGEMDGNIASSTSGTTTTECLGDHCWLHVGCKKCAPKDDCCAYVGQYCGTYVWVDRNNSDELTKLTLVILDFALRDPPVRLSKTVQYNIDELGLPTDKQRAVGTVTAQVAVNESNQSVLNMPREDEARINELLSSRLQVIQQKLAAHDQGIHKLNESEASSLRQEALQLEAKLRYLDEQLRTGGLKEQFYSTGTPIAPFSVMPLLQQQLQTLTAPRVNPE